MSDPDVDFEERFIRSVSRDIERRIIRHLNRIEEELEIINRVCERNRKKVTEILRRIVSLEDDVVRFDSYITGSEIIPEINLKDIPINDAKNIIHEYLQKNPGATTSDVFINLEILPEIVISSLSELREEGRIRGDNIE